MSKRLGKGFLRATREIYDPKQIKVTRRFRAKIAYDGTEFCGWQTQPNGQSVQDFIEGRLSTIFGAPCRVAGCSRTDAGVHAQGQVIHFEPPALLNDSLLNNPTQKWRIAPHLKEALLQKDDEAVAEVLRSMLCRENAGLPSSIQIQQIQTCHPAFHARHSAISKRYVYTIQEGRGNPQLNRFRWALGRRDSPLDLQAMRAAADLLCGSHDFSNFAVMKPTDTRDPVKNMTSLQVQRFTSPLSPGDSAGQRSVSCNNSLNSPNSPDGGGTETESVVTISATCDAFLYNMMRIISGTYTSIPIITQTQLLNACLKS